jgi:hypothetical protein
VGRLNSDKSLWMAILGLDLDDDVACRQLACCSKKAGFSSTKGLKAAEKGEKRERKLPLQAHAKKDQIQRRER